VLPALIWARARTGDGQRVGLKRAVIAAVLMAPIGFAAGLAYSRWLLV
jgi:hypothetical protein